VTEVRPGRYVFNDRSQIGQGAATDSDLAAFVVATVVGRPSASGS
jgi:D-serine deaminase-like pyridoxal phosphate-dependent protein